MRGVVVHVTRSTAALPFQRKLASQPPHSSA
jgi:hypothetical protein